MQPKSIALALILVSLTLGAVPSRRAFAQSPSSFSFTLQTSSFVSCWYFGISFDATQGQQISVQWSENSTGVAPVSLDFYIVPERSLNQLWLCDQGPVYAYWNQGSYGAANWVAPLTGAYAVLVVNYSYNAVSGMISVNALNSSLSANPIGPATVRRVSCMGGPPCMGSPNAAV